MCLEVTGAETARPYIEAANPDHPSLIDVTHEMDAKFGVVNIPNGVWIDEQGMIVISADNGHEAIQHVEKDPCIDVVLMDIMMPEMDGITTIQEIRRIPERQELPIIAVTAKAMKGDREKCIAAGAWDYLSKPVNTQDLLAALRAWLKD